MKIFFYFIAVCLIAIIFMIFFSPYSLKENGVRNVSNTVIIQAPVALVFDYLGNSDNASRWSVFVNHISTLNDNLVPDGAVGSLRRCYVNSDETGMRWDEETVQVLANQKRRLTIFNLKDFPMTADHLVTEQLYAKKNENQCELTFTLFYDVSHSNLWSELKMYLAAYRIERIFEQNMENIKRNLEELVNR